MIAKRERSESPEELQKVARNDNDESGGGAASTSDEDREIASEDGGEIEGDARNKGDDAEEEADEFTNTQGPVETQPQRRLLKTGTSSILAPTLCLHSNLQARYLVELPQPLSRHERSHCSRSYP